MGIDRVESVKTMKARIPPRVIAFPSLPLVADEGDIVEGSASVPRIHDATKSGISLPKLKTFLPIFSFLFQHKSRPSFRNEFMIIRKLKVSRRESCYDRQISTFQSYSRFGKQKGSTMFNVKLTISGEIILITIVSNFPQI